MAKNLKTSVQLDTSKAVKSLDALEKKIKSVQKTIERQTTVTNKLNTATNKLVTVNNKVAQSSNKATAAHNKQAKSVSMLTTKVRRLANAYLGVMGAKAMMNTANSITRAENQLNNLEGGNPARTQDIMDKVYATAMRSRSNYTDMLENVGKTMTLAPEAFGNNEDNAIRFQEIMAKSYALGNKSAAEQASSMYQLVQALGSGVLQGDELRSVREGATVAYKEIEKFAQSIYGADQNLKDLASDGKITSDIVVAAILNAGDTIDDKFKNTLMTFEDAMKAIRSTATKSFESVSRMLISALNSDAGKAIINGIGKAIQFVAGVLQIAFTWIGKIYSFVVDNWELIKNIFLTVATIIAVALIPKLVAVITCQAIMAARWIYTGAVAVASAIKAAAAWAIANWQFALILVVLAAVVIAIIWVADSFVDACGVVVGSLYWVWDVFKNIFTWMRNVAMGLWESIKAIGTNIGIAFVNAWDSAKSSFWGFIADCLQGLKWLEPAINAVAKAFGAEGFTLSGLITDVSAKATKSNQRSYVSVSDAWKTGYNSFEYNNLNDAYQEGYEKGVQGANWLKEKVNGAKEWLEDKLNLDDLMKGYGGSNNIDDLVNGVKGIGDDTGSIADSMELTQEDVEYLRKIADMEWKKEFTTATIQVDMSNYNTVNGDSDLDGIVTRLTDKLYEELNSVANGVYA